MSHFVTPPSAEAMVEGVRRFATTLTPSAEALDENAALLAEAFLRFQTEGLNAFHSARCPLSARESFDCLAALSEASGAFAFLALQQWVANMSFPDSGAEPFPRLGVAFGHLRRPDSPAPRWKDGLATGVVPWMTGAGMIERARLGVRLPDGREAFSWVDAFDRPTFQHSAPMALVACAGTNTVQVAVQALPLPESEFVEVGEPGALARGDAQGVLFQTPLMIGNVRAALGLIRESERLDVRLRDRCVETAEALLDEIFIALERGASPQVGNELRARIGDFSARLARLAAMHCGGASLLKSHPAQRLYREALLFSLMAQTDAIVHQAFESVFPAGNP